jgi:hypothetical protein
MIISTSAQLTAAKRSNLIGRSASTASFLIAALATRAWRRQPLNSLKVEGPLVGIWCCGAARRRLVEIARTYNDSHMTISRLKAQQR